jgi:moderate conductance mechanosensitive channel
MLPTNLQNLQECLASPDINQTFYKIAISVVAALVAYLIFSRVSNYWLRNVLVKVVEKSNLRKSRERQLKNWSLFIDRTGGILIIFVLFTTILSDLNYNITPLLTGVGIIGLAIGLGSQNFMKDVVSGIFIFLEGNYSEGDIVKVAGVSGKVKKIFLRKTILYSNEDKATHVIPHSEVKTVSILPKDYFEKAAATKAAEAKGLRKKKSVLKEDS